MLSLSSLRRFTEYQNINEVINNRPPLTAERFSIVSQSDVHLQELIFAPDPITGIPRSDLAFIMSKDASPEVAMYIRDTLMKPTQSTSVTTDADFALDSVKSRYESVEEYATRIRDILDSDIPNDPQVNQ